MQLNRKQAATLLGYDQASWDNASGKEAQPASASKKWTDLTAQERLAAAVLEYTEQTWRTVSLRKHTPWSDLTVTTGEDICYIILVLFGSGGPCCICEVQVGAQPSGSQTHAHDLSFVH